MGWASRQNARNQAKRKIEDQITLNAQVKTPSNGEPVVIELSVRKLLIFLRGKLCQNKRPPIPIVQEQQS